MRSLAGTHSASIAAIVEMQRTQRKDAWKLALVQRDVVWDEFRVAKLLDSILAGYPIGTLLLCRTKDRTYELDLETRQLARGDSWQLLDGQQRCVALGALFLPPAARGEERAVRFFWRLAGSQPDLKTGKRDPKILDYIRWGEPGSEEESKTLPPGATRGEWIDLALLGEWLLSKRRVDAAAIERYDEDALGRLLLSIDEAIEPVDDESFHVVRGRLARLVERFDKPWIPVQRIELEGAEDVLHVFARANMEGVRTSPADVFFAAVKTAWPDAEESLASVCQRSGGFLSRMQALRAVARVASLQEGGKDLVPLDVARLKGEAGRAVVDAMQKVSHDQELLDRWRRLGRYLAKPNVLGLGIRHIDEHLLDHVLAWIAARREPASTDELATAAGYVFWGSAFRLYGIFRDTFSRDAMTRAWEAGRSAESLPVEAILRYAREKWHNLSYGRGVVRAPWHASGRERREVCRAVVNDRGRLFLCIAQRIPIPLNARGAKKPISFDWDHIVAQHFRSTRMKWRGPDGKQWKRLHPKTYLMGRAGNLCLLEACLNRALQDSAPGAKLSTIDDYRKQGTLQPERLFLNRPERRLLGRLDDYLERREPEDVDGMMKVFERFVGYREWRLWRYAVRTFPIVATFRSVLFEVASKEPV
ncbi:MAG: DUF262 domain-containing protein [Polyangia bacterium]|jgi:hypothetical protein|nr:DUF262 domain-containing protein [Polyangia bacterium]